MTKTISDTKIQESGPNLKHTVQETFQYIIKGSLDRIIFFETDSIMNHIIRLYVSEPEKADEKLVFIDKFYLYRLLWRGILETLYDKFLPLFDYTFKWEIEITPYTMMLCELSKENVNTQEIETQKKIMQWTDDDIEQKFDSILTKEIFEKLGIKGGLDYYLPVQLIPKMKKDQMILFMRLMNFPPLGELKLFLSRFNQHLREQVSKLSISFSINDERQVPKFNASEPLHYSWFHIDHTTFKKYGLDGFKKNPLLVEFKQDIETIHQLANNSKDKFSEELICPCCGQIGEFAIPEDYLQYKYLLENQILCKNIGLIYLNDFIGDFEISLNDRYYSFIPNLNNVNNPDCLILVEGDSEESSIPILAFRKRFILSKHHIHVYNSKSKERLFNDFLGIKQKYPDRKMICLLDSDAVKERDDIQRIINDHKDLYRLVFINKGTLEDIFDLNISIQILNEMYPDGELITIDDFQLGKNFLSNIKQIMFQKKKATFDKVLFAKKISMKIDIDKLPNEIEELLSIANDFTRK